MSLTIRDITRVPHLRTRLVAGASGADRDVTWAAVCELPDPTEWLGDGDLLMTTGLSVPAGDEEQRRFVELLAEAGLCGMALCESGLSSGKGMNSPELTAALFAAADEHRFPVLLVEHQVPFVAVAHAVANASQKAEHDRLTNVMRLYECLRDTRATGPRSPDVLANAAEICGCALVVVDRVTLAPPFETWPDLAELVRASLAQLLAGRSEPLAAWVRFEAGGDQAVALALPGQRAEILVAVSTGAPLDQLLLQHTATIMAIEVERATAERERMRLLGGDLLQQLLDRRVGLETALELLSDHGCGCDPWLVAAVGLDADFRDLDARGVGSIEVRRGDAVYALVSAGQPAAQALAELAAARGAMGVSRPFSELVGVAGAFREARFALGVAVDTGERLSEYQSNADVLVAARSIGEAEQLVDAMLGPVREYDSTHQSDLEHTLRVFLEENRSWQRGSTRLHLHKQTLVYRIRQIERLTGRSLSSTADVAGLWLALEAARRLAPDAVAVNE